VSLAKSLDVKVSESWIGHPYFNVIDNSSDFENKICRMIAVNIKFNLTIVVSCDSGFYFLLFYLYCIDCLSEFGHRHC